MFLTTTCLVFVSYILSESTQLNVRDGSCILVAQSCWSAIWRFGEEAFTDTVEIHAPRARQMR